jgi:ATP-dependent helicase HrpB
MPSLPIHEILPSLRETLASHAAVVLQAPPGAGKTTIVPPALLYGRFDSSAVRPVKM